MFYLGVVLKHLRKNLYTQTDRFNADELTVCDAGQGLVEGGRVAVISECDTHSSRKKPPGQSEGLLVLK